MPHCLIEYSDNLGAEADVPGLLRKIAAKYSSSGGLFPLVGVRVRALPVSDYVIADGNPDNAFAHATCVIAPGRSEPVIRGFFTDLFELMKQHLAPAAADRFLGLSLDVSVASETGSYKYNFGVTRELRPSIDMADARPAQKEGTNGDSK